VTYVRQPALSRVDQEILERNLSHARAMGAEVTVLEGLDPLDAILAFARRKGVTQIFIGHSLHEGGASALEQLRQPSDPCGRWSRRDIFPH